MAGAYILIFIICVLLIIVVLLQNSKGGGLAANFTGSNIMGVRKTADFLEKATWSLAGALLLFCVIINSLPKEKGVEQKSVLQEEIKNAIDPNATPKIPTAAPSQEGQQAPAPAPAKEEKK